MKKSDDHKRSRKAVHKRPRRMSKEESIAVILREAKEASEALRRQRPGTLEEMKAQGLRTRPDSHSSSAESSEAGTPAPKPRKYTHEQWDRLLQEAGWRDATLDGPTAFELPGYPNSQPKQD